MTRPPRRVVVLCLSELVWDEHETGDLPRCQKYTMMMNRCSFIIVGLPHRCGRHGT
jgi:hypothetical protein